MSLLNGVRAYYNFEGNGNDISGNNNNTTPTNVVFSIANGIIAQGGGFNGSSSRMVKTSSSLPTGNNSLSISFWFKTSSLAGSGGFPCILQVSSTTGFATSLAPIGYESNNRLYIGTNGSDINTGITINTNSWFHCCVTYTANTIRVYVNNILTNTVSRTMNLGNANISIGYALSSGGQYFNGQIDEVGFWTRQLSAQEVSILYNNGFGNSYPFSNAAFLLQMI